MSEVRRNSVPSPLARSAAPAANLAPVQAVLNKLFGSALHEHADPAQRVIGIAQLAPDSPALAQLLADPAPEVRAAAAARCADPDALAAALAAESDPGVRGAIEAALGKAVAALPEGAAAQALLAAADCSDAVRAAVALGAPDDERRRAAIEGIRDEGVLVDLALAAAHAPVRLAAAERVHAPEALRRLAEGAKDKDRGVARLARQRLDAIERRAQQAAAADAILAQAEALIAQPGAILTAAVELDRRWKALGMEEDADRHARWEAIGARMQQRFDREREAQRAHAQLEQRVAAWLAALQPQPPTAELPALRAELAALRAEATAAEDAPALDRLAQAEAQLARWEQAAPGLAAAEALVQEAEELAAATPIDDAQLPTRWQALDLAVRTPALTRRFEAALLVIEQRRLAYVRATQQEQGAARQRLHALLHQAEQAVAAGQLAEARSAVDEARKLKPDAGLLPKPSVQRLSRVVQQLVELERWEKFGQQNARVQLAERAEALATATLAPAALAREVQQLRAEWKKLDEQYAGVPKALWERFDGACEKAYAPAARHFAEQAAQHKQARKQREDFIAAAEAHAPTLLAEPRDLRAIERWLRETDATWHGTSLGSVDPGAWKKLDAKIKAAVAPARDALTAARQQAKADRQALIAEAEALAAKAMERDAPSKVKELQARWQQVAKQVPLAQRDERALWDKFRAACNAVFDARQGARKEADERRHAQRQAFEVVCEQMERLAGATDKDELQVRREQRELQEQWKKALAESGPPPAGLDARFRGARAKVDDALRGRTRAQQAEQWQALLAKERLAEELDALVIAEKSDAALVESVQQRWTQMALPTAWEGKLAARRDAALRALADEDARYDFLDRLDESNTARRDALLELELMLHLDSPADLQPQRLAVQVKQLRDRFKRAAAGAGSAEQILLDWCAQPGVADERDRGRCERIIERLAPRR